VRVRITGMDLLTLDLHATLATRLDDAPAGANPSDEAADDDEAAAAAPLSLALDLGDGEPAAPAAPAPLPPEPASPAA
jgi:exoribonuclease-2